MYSYLDHKELSIAKWGMSIWIFRGIFNKLLKQIKTENQPSINEIKYLQLYYILVCEKQLVQYQENYQLSSLLCTHDRSSWAITLCSFIASVAQIK